MTHICRKSKTLIAMLLLSLLLVKFKHHPLQINQDNGYNQATQLKQLGRLLFMDLEVLHKLLVFQLMIKIKPVWITQLQFSLREYLIIMLQVAS